MRSKTSSKPKVKAAYASIAKIANQPGGAKTFQYGKSGKPYEKTTKAGKANAVFGSHTPSALQMHEAGYGTHFADAGAVGLETNPLEEETELARKLVAEVAEAGSDVNALCETYDLKREELGRLTGFSLRALAEWASGRLPSQPAKRRLHEVRRLLDALAGLVKRESISAWLHKRNPAFDNLTPLQVIEVGEMDRLWAMLHDLASGQPE